MAATLLQLRIDLPYIAAGIRPCLVQGVLTTLWISLVSISIATVLALFGALVGYRAIRLPRVFSGLYFSVIAGRLCWFRYGLSTWGCHRLA